MLSSRVYVPQAGDLETTSVDDINNKYDLFKGSELARKYEAT